MENKRDNRPLDLSYLTEMVGDDPVFMIEIFDTFIEQTPFYVAELEDALSKKDWKRVAHAAHKIKPTFSYIGRTDVKELVQIIETDANKQENVEAIPLKVEQLHQIIDDIYSQLSNAIVEVKTKCSL